MRILPSRLPLIRCLILDETIGDPSITFTNRKHWNRIWRTVAKMTRLKVLYLNVDTLYPRLWDKDRESRLLGPLAAVTQTSELCIILRWKAPDGVSEDAMEHGEVVRGNVKRVDDFALPDDLYKAYPPADMRYWITEKLRFLEYGLPIGRKDSATQSSV